MKPTFHHSLVNGKFEDPCVYVRMLREKRALLFDIGDICKLKPSDILKITEVFVTHTHMDHFIGFDTLLRALLRREKPLSVYGPENITECIEGRLRGYAWNLIEKYPVKIEVFGISRDKIKHSSFYAENSFRRVDIDERPFDGIVLKELSFCIKAALLSHGIPCLGFSLEEDFHINIDKSTLTSMGLSVGPWLSDFKKMIRNRVCMDTMIKVEGMGYSVSELMGIVRITKGQKLSYIVDVSPEDKNINNVVGLVKDSDTLYCEAYFLHKDIERAFERQHLTAMMAGEIAKKAGVKNLVVIHFSPKYKKQPDAIEMEAMEEFSG